MLLIAQIHAGAIFLYEADCSRMTPVAGGTEAVDGHVLHATSKRNDVNQDGPKQGGRAPGAC